MTYVSCESLCHLPNPGVSGCVGAEDSLGLRGPNQIPYTICQRNTLLSRCTPNGKREKETPWPCPQSATHE